MPTIWLFMKFLTDYRYSHIYHNTINALHHKVNKISTSFSFIAYWRRNKNIWTHLLRLSMNERRTSIRICNAMPMINEFPPANVFCSALIEIIIIIVVIIIVIFFLYFFLLKWHYLKSLLKWKNLVQPTINSRTYIMGHGALLMEI